MVTVGDKAKDLTLKDHKGKKVNLSDFSGRKGLLSFHPLAWTNVCVQQMKKWRRIMQGLRSPILFLLASVQTRRRASGHGEKNLRLKDWLFSRTSGLMENWLHHAAFSLRKKVFPNGRI
jgi:hypothetical protein